MDKQKSYNKKNYGTAYFAVVFLAAFFFEFYWIMTNPYNYFMLLGTGIIMIIMGYLTIDSILKAKADSEALKAEQNDMMLKAQKAIYIATKKNTKDAEARQRQNLKAVELMMNKMISTQQALLEDKKPAADDMSSLIDQLSASNEKLAKEVQSAITVNQLVKANADLVKNVREALSAGNSLNTSAADLSSYVSQAVGTVNQTVPAKPATSEATTAEPTQDIEVETATDSDFNEMPEAAGADAPEVFPSEVITDELSFDSDLTMNAIENEINLAEMAESEAIEDMTIPDELTPELDAAVDDGTSEEIMSDISEDMVSDITEEAEAASTDDSPNKQLSEEEIAALFASL